VAHLCPLPGDDKAPIVAMLVVIDALRAGGMAPSVN
jgi:hypothetical protein